jgi:aspartyl-tRNA(Asn)/glutamyl-tRNA(Gln) amidotransferase subunit B
MSWEAVIGLEIHVQLSTQSKIFSGSSTAVGAPPNTQASAIDIGLPGVLPVVNEGVYHKAVAFGLGIGAKIGRKSVFDRKNYFYPDLPKGYQITQLDYPIVLGGSVDIFREDGTSKTIRVTRAHLEEDAGKSLHEDYHGMTGIDLNRAGMPLLEIVSEPDMRSAEEAVAYARYIHQLVCYLDVSDGDMSQGSLRCDANVSIRHQGETSLGTRTETKNVNSFKFLERAINYEIERQTDLLESGGRVIQETRLYDPDKDETRPMRSKETATDYRYFPEPDLLPVVLDDEYIKTIAKHLPELPRQRTARFVSQFQLSEIDALTLTSSRETADFFEAVNQVCDDPRLANNWIRVELVGQLNKDGVDLKNSPVSPDQLGDLLRRIKDETISAKTAKSVLESMLKGEGSADHIIATQGLEQVSDDDSIELLIDEIIAKNPDQVEQFMAGKEKVLGFLVGQVMKATQGKANPKKVNDIFRKKIG